MIELATELYSVTAMRPSQVALILGIVDLAVLRQVGRKPEAEVRISGVRETDVRGTRGDVGDSTLGKALAAGKLEKALAVADTNLLDEIACPLAGIIPSVLSVLSGNSHKRAAGDDAGAQGGIAILVDKAEEEAVFGGDLPVPAADDLSIVKIISDNTIHEGEGNRDKGGAIGNRNVLHRSGRLGIARSNAVGAELLQSGHGGVAGESGCQIGKASGSRRGLSSVGQTRTKKS